MDAIYDTLEDAWNRTCKIVLGDEVGPLKDYTSFLHYQLDHDASPLISKVKISGEEKRIFHPLLRGELRLLKDEQMDEMTKWKADINTIKDIDSLTEEIKHVAAYRAYEVFGNSRNVEKSDLVTDSSFVYDSYMVESSKYVFASCWIRDGGAYTFGCGPCGPGLQFAIRCNWGGWLKRALETYYYVSSSDTYYSFLIKNCQDAMFCFFQNGKRNIIGNLELSKDTYLKIKTSLLEQIRDELKSKKTLPTLFDLINNSPTAPTDLDIPAQPSSQQFNQEIVENGFRKTLSILFGSASPQISTGDFVKKTLLYHRSANVLLPEKGKNMFDQDVVKFHVGGVGNVELKRIVPEAALPTFSRLKLEKEEVESFDQIKKNIGKIGFICAELYAGTNKNLKDVLVAFNSQNILSVFDATKARDQAYNLVACPESTHTYFSSVVFNSSFVIGGFCSVDVKRALEVDRCVHSSDIFYCHNCDGCQNAMFSLHQKGKRYIIGNNVLSPSDYAKVKSALLEQIVERWNSGKQLSVLDLFSVAHTTD